MVGVLVFVLVGVLVLVLVSVLVLVLTGVLVLVLVGVLSLVGVLGSIGVLGFFVVFFCSKKNTHTHTHTFVYKKHLRVALCLRLVSRVLLCLEMNTTRTTDVRWHWFGHTFVADLVSDDLSGFAFTDFGAFF